MTPDKLRSLVDAVENEDADAQAWWDAIDKLELARLFAEVAVALERVCPWVVEERFETAVDAAARAALAKLYELEPRA